MSRELMQQALEALIWTTGSDDFGDGGKAREGALKLLFPSITALRERLAQPEQEPVAWRDHVEQRILTWRQSFVNKSGDQLALDDFMDKQSLDDLIDFVCDEYTSPPASKPFVGLTDDELEVIANECRLYPRDFARAIEAKLKERNT